MKELEWFCQNAYNLGLKHASDWDLKSVVRMLTACVHLIRNFPDDIAAEVASDLSLRSIFCNFLIASALVALARAEDNLESQLQAYLVMRKHIAEVDHEVETRLQSKNVDDVSARDLLAKLAQLLAFDFEAAMALKKYPDLGEIVLKANQCRNVETFKAMADCALRSRLPPEGTPHCKMAMGSFADSTPPVQSFSVSSEKLLIRYRISMTLIHQDLPRTRDVSSKQLSLLTRSWAVGSWMRSAQWSRMRIR